MDRICRAFQQYPITCNVSFAGTLALFSDCVLQKSVKSDDSHFVDTNSSTRSFDFQRCGAIVTFGALYDGGVNTLVYRLYERYIIFASPLAGGFAKSAVDNFCHSPYLYLPAFFFVTNGLKGRAFSDTWTQFRQQYRATVLSMWCFWFPFQLFNFALIPPVFRVAVTNIGCLWWTAWAEHLAHSTFASEFITPLPSSVGAPRGSHHLPVTVLNTPRSDRFF